MYKIVLPILLALLMPVTASAQPLSFEFCSKLGEHSGQLMNDRQRGLPISTPREAIKRNYQNGNFTYEYAVLLLDVVDTAYSFPIQSTPRQKTEIIREFSAYMTQTCLDIQ